MTFGERLRRLRECKYTQEELADMLHVHNNTISKWENGTQEPRAKRVAELAKILGTTPAYLLEDTETSVVSEPIGGTIIRNRQQSNHESSENTGMLVYETANGNRFEAPPTETGIKYLERMFAMALSGKQVAMA